MNVLEVCNLKKRVRHHFWSAEKEILKGIDFTVPKGSVTGLLGPNGAGKTTIFKVLLRLIKRNGGEIRFFERTDWTPSVKARIGFSMENPCFYEEMSLRETILFFGRLSALPAAPAGAGAAAAGRTEGDLKKACGKNEALKERAEFLMEKLKLLPDADKPLRSFSRGMLQKTSLAQAFIHSPDFALLDEPFSGLDPEGRAAAFSFIEEMKREGRTALLSSHILPDVERLCDRLLILKEGRMIFQGTKEELIQKTEARPAAKPRRRAAAKAAGGERRRIVFLQERRERRLKNLSLSECRKEIDRLRKEKIDILSVERETFDLESAYKKILSAAGANGL